MLTPYLMAKNMFDELAESAFSANTLRGMMNTDIKESDQGYELDIDLPGVHKENLSAELKDGYSRFTSVFLHFVVFDEQVGDVLRGGQARFLSGI